MAISFYKGTNNEALTTHVTGLVLNEWTMITYAHDAVAKTINPYWNSTLQEWGVVSYTFTPSTTLQPFSIGLMYPLTLYYAYYDGLVDEYGVWNRALSGAEIIELWNGGAGMTYTPEAGFNAAWARKTNTLLGG
jgi:hypothetical protein